MLKHYFIIFFCLPLLCAAQSGGCDGSGSGFVSETYINTTGTAGGDYTINPGAKLHIGPNGNFTVYGGITNNGTVQVDAGGILTVQGDVTNNGTVTISPSATFAYYGINWVNNSSAAVNGGGALYFNGPQLAVPASFTTNSSCLNTYTDGSITKAQNLNGGDTVVPMSITLHANNTGTIQLTGTSTYLMDTLQFDTDGSYIVANNYKFIFGAAATHVNASPARYIQTNTTIGEVEKKSLAAGSSFRFPVGFNIPTDYTPADVSVSSGPTDNYHVNVVNFANNTPSQSFFTTLPNVQRTWTAYADAGLAVAGLTFYHYPSLETNGYNDNSTEVYRLLNTGKWQPGTAATCAAEASPFFGSVQYEGQQIQNVTLPTCAGCSSGANGSYYSKTMCAGIAGIVWDDINANAVFESTENPTNGNGLYANLVSGGVVTQSVAVNASTGAYAFSSLLTGSYNVVLTNTAALTTSVLNSGWVNTGVNLSGIADSSNKTGIITVPVSTSSVTTGQDFGILQCSQTGLSIAASASPALVCASSPVPVSLTSTPSGGIAAYTSYVWAGSGVVNPSLQNTTANPTASGQYNVTVTDAIGCTATGYTANVIYDNATPSITFMCGTNANNINYVQLDELNGINWLWTTANGSRFYTSNLLSSDSDSATSHLQAPFIDFRGTYNVQITDANGCAGSGSILIDSASCLRPLSISNLSFDASKIGNNALLSWSAVGETNNSYFSVERSSDGNNWQVIGTVQGKGSSSTITRYSFTDALPLIGADYYRLKLVDVNGLYSYSSVRALTFSGQLAVKLYPNPVQDYLVLEFNNEKNEKANIVIQNMLGNTVFATQQQLITGLNRITLNNVQQLTAGTYMVVMGTTENTYRLKFIKGN